MVAQAFKTIVISIFLPIPQSTLREKWPYSELFWSAFSRIWTEYEKILRPYSVQMRENADLNNYEYEHYFFNQVSTKSEYLFLTCSFCEILIFEST